MVIALCISLLVNIILAVLLWRLAQKVNKMFVAGQAVAYKEILDSVQTIATRRDES